MRVTWAATAPESGRYSAVEKDSDIGLLEDHFDALRLQGQGYLEVRLPGGEFPWLSVGFHGDRAVIHLFDHPERSSLLVGDGTAMADAVVYIPVMDELVAFSGGFVLTVDRAWVLVRSFLRPGHLENWASGVSCDHVRVAWQQHPRGGMRSRTAAAAVGPLPVTRPPRRPASAPGR